MRNEQGETIHLNIIHWNQSQTSYYVDKTWDR